ncbi:hypothetical protein NLI96_g10167 [Meripilus lineatus]|uniref:Uncharacterized protein n=1 Tax=Meripilus lineatus TaxID=2056292 RepID=A0AAD5UU97_9APHY|nr:hypothetical protein NLI96_g10167 [Physisporinus lineatus]
MPKSIAESFLGADLIEVFVAFVLYGISLAQAYLYSYDRKRDTLWLQGLVLVVIILETVHSAMVMQATYFYVIAIATNPFGALHILWSVGLFVIFGPPSHGCVAFRFYIRRIWILSKGSYLTTLIPFATVVLRANVIVNIESNSDPYSPNAATGIYTYVLDNWLQFHSQIRPRVVLISGLAFSAASDVLIAGVLIYLLHKSRTGFKELSSIGVIFLVGKIMTHGLEQPEAYSYEQFAFKGNSLSFVGLSVLTNKLYANSLLGTYDSCFCQPSVEFTRRYDLF